MQVTAWRPGMTRQEIADRITRLYSDWILTAPDGSDVYASEFEVTNSPYLAGLPKRPNR
jgi:hypothetical protein